MAHGVETSYRVSTTSRWHFTFVLCCHNNETRAPIANPPNSAQLESTPFHSPKLHLGPFVSVGMRRGTHTHTQMHVTYMHFTSSTLRLTRNVIMLARVPKSAAATFEVGLLHVFDHPV